MAASKKQVVYREADKGRFVPKEYADKHPKTTVKETNKRGK